MGFLQAIKDTINAPFKQPLDLLHLFLAVGLVIVIVIVWNYVLGRYILEEI